MKIEMMEVESIESIKSIFQKENSMDFYYYLNLIGLMKNYNKILILPSSNHFYYDFNDLLKFQTIIGLKKLNYVYNLDNFIFSLYKITGDKTIFCGCFLNNKRPKYINKSFKYRKFLEALISIADNKMVKLLSRKDIYSLFKAYNFKIINMNEINDVTYFYVEKNELE